MLAMRKRDLAYVEQSNAHVSLRKENRLMYPLNLARDVWPMSNRTIQLLHQKCIQSEKDL